MSTLQTSQLRRHSVTSGVKYNIEFERESGIYLPGEFVCGEILFQTLSKEREPLKGLKTRLSGVEEIRWGDNFVVSTNEFLVLDAYSPRSENECEGQEEDVEDGIPSPENYKYPFRFELPIRIPQSFQGNYGSVRYFVETVLSENRLVGVGGTTDGSNWLDFANLFRKQFEVKGLLDLNSIQDVSTPGYLLKDNTGGLSSLFMKNKHPVTFVLKISKTGFVPGEVLRFTVDITNDSSHDVSETSIALIQNIKYIGGQISREDSNTILKRAGPSVALKSFKTWADCFRIPNLLATELGIPGHSTSIKYRLRIKITTSILFDNIKGDLPIVIGTIPVEYDDFETPQVRSNSFRVPPGGGNGTINRSKILPCSHLDLARADSKFVLKAKANIQLTNES